MNPLSRLQGLVAILAATVTTTSMAERSASSQCTNGDNYFSKILYVANSTAPNSCGNFGTENGTSCYLTACPGMNVVLGRTSPFQRQDDFPGNFPSDPRMVTLY